MRSGTNNSEPDLRAVEKPKLLCGGAALVLARVRERERSKAGGARWGRTRPLFPMSSEADDAGTDEVNSSLLYPDPWEATAAARPGITSGAVIGMILNLLNSVTGPSLLLAPFAFYSAGAIGGAVLLLVAIALQVRAQRALFVFLTRSDAFHLHAGRVCTPVGQAVVPRSHESLLLHARLAATR
jgi:hypothetical protein